jgi:hypothetical protein
MDKLTHKDNVYAYDSARFERHISEVEGGKKGYYCIGCGQEMIAKKGLLRAQHFAHDPKDVTHKGKCTFSDETFRHKLAKETLQRLKRIKVPAVYKFPPLGSDQQAIKIRDAEFIHANEVKIELQIFEDEEGNICFGRGQNFTEGSGKYLLIQPDVVFFDSHKKPILLIEMVATHKVDATKISKLKRLGINTVQVKIPKSSRQEIEDNFFSVQRTEWVYNYEQETTPYLSVFSGDSQGIPPLNEFQRKLLKIEESYNCRAAEINNLIRGINRALETEQYQKITRNLRAELYRVEGNTTTNKERWEQLQEQYKIEVEREFENEERELARRREEFSRRRTALRDKKNRLERRYTEKAASIEELQNDYRPGCQAEIERIESLIREYGANPDDLRDGMGHAKERRAAAEENHNRELKSLGHRYLEVEGEIRDIEGRRTALPAKYQRLEEDLRREIGEREKSTRRAVEEETARSIRAIENEDIGGAGELSRRLRGLLEARELLSIIPKEQDRLKRLRKAKELLEAKTYENWI